MATHDKDSGGMFELSRRDFLKVGAGAAAAGAIGADFAFAPSRADAGVPKVTKTTTCPYCSAQCGQLVDVAIADGTVLDIYGDPNSPTNRGGLCSKGAAGYQLATNTRRLGVSEHTSSVDGFNFTGTAWRRTGNAAWENIPLSTAMTEIATQLVTLRDASGAPSPGLTAASNVKTVQFFGSSHMNNEPNYMYRKLIASFGTSLTEHQARI